MNAQCQTSMHSQRILAQQLFHAAVMLQQSIQHRPKGMASLFVHSRQ